MWWYWERKPDWAGWYFWPAHPPIKQRTAAALNINDTVFFILGFLVWFVDFGWLLPFTLCDRKLLHSECGHQHGDLRRHDPALVLR
jgi:hypothetical protein